MRKTVRLLACATLLTAATSAYAGYRTDSVVSVSPGKVVGCVGGARNTGGPAQRIFCKVVNNAWGVVWAMCLGADSTGNVGSCSTDAPALVERASTLRATSVVQFTWDDSGRCNNIYVNNNSYCNPKTHW